MRVIKLNATDSTNSYLKKLYANKWVEDYTVVITENQKQGRGQMGTFWLSEGSKNLTFSVFKSLDGFNLEKSFYISMVTSLAILKTLEGYSIPKLSVKWPNDILSADKKICGVLIENVIKQHSISASIIGIGLNVNQILFENLPKASSLKLISNKTYNIEALSVTILNHLKHYFLMLEDEKYDELKAEYERCLFRKNKPSTFKNAEGFMFPGFIKSVSQSGKLQVLLEDHVLKEFNLKEVTLLY